MSGLTEQELRLVEFMRQRFAEAIRREIAQAPPLSDEDRRYVRALLGDTNEHQHP
jgi:hypothetical protein